MSKEFIQLRLTLTRLDWARVNQLLAAGVIDCYGDESPQELDQLRRVRDLIHKRLEEVGL